MQGDCGVRPFSDAEANRVGEDWVHVSLVSLQCGQQAALMVHAGVRWCCFLFLQNIISHFRAKFKAVRLQNYWKKICEDEKRSQWRNEQLLRDVERVENHMASLTEKTEKLKLMKVTYQCSKFVIYSVIYTVSQFSLQL